MRNIEIKARLEDPRAAEAAAASLAGHQPQVLHQVDTYFNLAQGRLKLREHGEAGPAELIFYRRGDAATPRPCDYEIVPVADPGPLKALLARALGVKTVVAKERRVFLYRNVRIHLDRVEGLGSFIEFEAAMDPGSADAEGEGMVTGLMERFSISPHDVIAGSYCDLVNGEAGIPPE